MNGSEAQGRADPRPVADVAPDPLELERRVTELEIQAGFSEDLLETLNAQVARQQEIIETLVREIGRLREQQAKTGTEPPRSLRDELPPHY
ncbi:MAG: SlyX family protein [Burkholderiaceae bacterium]|nr:SlyX family protein [Burkholderiaceae bacterium]